MRTRVERRVTARYRWDRLRVSVWFAPALMALAAVLLAWAIYQIDLAIPNEALENSRLILSGTSDDLRSGLLAMATTVLATAGVVFTLLTLPLSTVAAQYGSRLLRFFLSDRTIQMVLGMFVGTFVYCIAVALTIVPAEIQPQSPQLTATFGLYLMLATFASLIVLVQHVSTMLQAPNIAAAAGARLMDAVRAENTEADTDAVVGSDAMSAPPANRGMETAGDPVWARKAGYIQYIDPEIMLAVTRENDLTVRLLRKPGHFVGEGTVVALVWPAGRVHGHLAERIERAFQIGNVRTPTQDVEYAVNQLVEMAVRAMSPAINDPFTAMTCLDYLAQGLARFVQQEERNSHYYDPDGQLRLVLEPATFDELLSAAFDMLRHASNDNASVLLHMLAAIDVIGQEARAPMPRQSLRRYVGLIQAESQAGHLIESDRQLIQRSSEALLLKLATVQPSAPGTLRSIDGWKA